MENTETGAEKEDKAIGEKQITVDDKIVQIVIDDSTGISLDDFHTNDKKILSLLNQDSDINDKQYTFNGLARKLGMHQQSLSRALHRLEDAGLVQRTENGYKLSKNLRSILVNKSRIDLENLSKRISKQYLQFTQILQLYIPTTVKAEQVVNRLVGKWFGNLRWIGLVEGDGGYVLQWENSDRFQVNMKIISRYAIIESNAVGEKNKADAMLSAYRILEQITKILKTVSDKSDRRNGLDSFSQYN
ncbi:MAG: MarR family transcriptional regulator [Thaumarchaeota archaeon]|nr:MAG: MarR family transcriptional regulator [Nitrososphaerota archaeon]TLX95743.1 MAG: MarR family transcriptional regulator [Nitrososphaerota archaeon]